MASASEPRPASAWRRWRPWLSLILVAAGVAVAYRLVAGIDWAELSRRLRQSDRADIVLVVAFLAARFVAWNWRMSIPLPAIGVQVPVMRRMAILLGSVALNHLTPAARVLGGLFRVRHLGRYSGTPRSPIFGAVVADQIVYQATIVLLTWFALIGGAVALGRRPAAVGIALAGVLLLAVAFGGWRLRGAGSRPLARLAERRIEAGQRAGVVFARGREVIDAVRLLLRESPAVRIRLVVASLAFYGSNVAAQVWAFHAIGSPVDPVTVALAITVGAGAGVLTGTPGGVATTEAAMVASFVALGVDRVDAVAATLIYRGLHYIVVLALGLPALAALELGRSDAGAEAPENEPDGDVQER